jgi:hypothetical protein
LRKPPNGPGSWWLARLTQRRCGWHHRSEPSRFERPMRVGQAARTGLLRERESDNGPFRRSRLLRSTLAEARCGDATPAEGSRPPGSSGARRRDPSVEPTRVWSSGFWSRGTVVYSTAHGPVAPLSRSDLGRKTGCTRVRPGLRLLSRSTVRLVRPVSAEASSTRPLQDQAQGSIGAGALATATLPTDSAAEQGLAAGRRQRSRRTQFATVPPASAAA